MVEHSPQILASEENATTTTTTTTWSKGLTEITGGGGTVDVEIKVPSLEKPEL